MLQIDFDFKDLLEWGNFYKFYKAVHELSMICKPIVRETHKGFHVYCNIELPPEKLMTLRYYYGDDEWRLSYDEQRLKQASHLYDVLYEEKKVFYMFGRVKEHYREREISPESWVM